MSKNKSITKNYIYNLVYQILVLIVPLITTPYLSRVLGVENIGIYGYTLSISTYFILFGTLGVSMYAQREIAYVQNDKYERSKIFWEILLMRFCSLGISLVIYYFTFMKNGEYCIYYRILMLEILANSIDISWFFQGLEEFKKTVAKNFIVKIISIILIFVLVKSQGDLIEYFLIFVFSNLLGNFTLWLSLSKYTQKINFKELNIFRHLKSTLALFIPQIAIQIYTVLDKTMIGNFVRDKSEVGFYEQAQKMVKILLTISTSLGTVMIPRMANTFANGEKEKLKEYMNKSFKFIFLIAFPLMFGIISISDKFIPIFYGTGYDKVIYLVNVLSPIIVIIGLSNVIGTQYLLPIKRQKEFTVSVTIGALINFILNIILIRLYKSIGAAISTVLAETTVTIVLFYLIRKEFTIMDVLKKSIKYLIAAMIMFFMSCMIGLLISNNLISIISQILIGCIVYVICLLVLKDDLIYEAINIIKRKLKIQK